MKKKPGSKEQRGEEEGEGPGAAYEQEGGVEVEMKIGHRDVVG